MKPVFEKPKMFISHGRAGESLNIFRSFLEALEFEVIVVIDEPSSGMALSHKVKSHIEYSDCILVIATPDNKDEASNNYQPRANVSHEIGYAEALSKPIVYIKHDDVSFGTNYSDKVWISFSDRNYHLAYKQIIEETKKLKLLSIVGKVNKESIKSEIVGKLIRLVDILNITDHDIKSNILYEISLALYKRSEELTDAETKDFSDFYPEYTQTCAYDGYKNENLDEAIRLLSFSLQINPLSSRKADYIAMLSDALYVGEGMVNEDIERELNALIMEEARYGNLFHNQKHIEKIEFYLDILNDNNRPLFWGHASSTDDISPDLSKKLKRLIIGVFGRDEKVLTSFNRPSGFPRFFSISQYDHEKKDAFNFKTRLEETIENAGYNEKRLMFKFLCNHLSGDDLDSCLSIIAINNKDIASKVIWVIGEANFPVSAKMIDVFESIFLRNDHLLIGVIATAIGKIGTNKFNDHLVTSLRDFDINSRRRIIWCMGKLKNPVFKEALSSLKVEDSNYALKEELDNSLRELSSI
jgi:hypothetical protein